MEYGSREGWAAYGYEGYFKVASVMIISAMSDATSKRRQEERKSGGHKEFGQLLEEAKQQQQESLQIY